MELIDRARAGDRAALDQLLREIAPLIGRFARRMCGREDEDVVQETLLAVAQHLHAFEGRASLPTWVFTLARTACNRHRRREHPSEELEEAVAETPSPEQLASAGEAAAIVERALDALPPEYREVLHLRDVEGLSAAETAQILGLGEAAVKSRLHRARAALKEAVAPSRARAASCPDVIAAWSRKHEGDLDAAACAEMEAHVQGCASCTAACDALRTAVGACTRAREVTPELREQIERAVRRVAGQRFGGV
jgi:RNA polymerase sigma-70 factor (ECF subfamily)